MQESADQKLAHSDLLNMAQYFKTKSLVQIALTIANGYEKSLNKIQQPNYWYTCNINIAY